METGLIVIAASAVALLALGAFRRFILPKLKAKAAETETKLDDVALEVVDDVAEFGENVAKKQLGTK